ncbi:hypothetical protein K474DRAFT_1567761, partial [Panus rudis PR-1116 ss-1]
AMLHEAGLSGAFWPEAHEYATTVYNMTISKTLIDSTPHEALRGTKPDVSTLRVFGSRCHVRVSPELRHKLDAHSLDGIFCGFT